MAESPFATAFDDLPEAKSEGEPVIGPALFDDLPDEKPTTSFRGAFDDLPDDPRFATRIAKRRELEAQMAKARAEGRVNEAITRTFGEMEDVAATLQNPLRAPERAVEGVASIVAGQPLEIQPQYRPSEMIRKPAAEIPQIPQQEGALKQTAAGALNAVIDFTNFFLTPEGALTLGIGYLPKAAQQALLRSFAVGVGTQSPQTILHANEAAARGDLQEAAKLAMTGGGEALFSSLMARHGTAKPVIREAIEPQDRVIIPVIERAEAAKAPATAEALRQIVIERDVIKPAELQQPAAAEPASTTAPRPKPAERPWDIIDEIESSIGKIRGKKSASPGTEGYYGEAYREASRSEARRVFSNARGSSPDEAVDSLRRSGHLPKDATVDDLWSALINAGNARRGARGAKSREESILDREEGQRVDFEKNALRASEQKHAINVSELMEGDAIGISGETFKVKELVFDRDTGELGHVVLEDGKRFGVQTVGADQVIHAERFTFHDRQKTQPGAEQRIGSKPERENLFDMDPGDLADYFNERFGEQRAGGAPLEAGRAGTFRFPSYDAFKTWMLERYGERDLEGMKIAFAEAETAAKIRFIRENRGAEQHLRDWIASLATGSPLPKESPPIPRTTPRPIPGGGTQPVTPPPARPGQPPPPPRQPSFFRKFDLQALVQLARQFGNFPTINDRLMRAYGRFIPGTKSIELKERLLWDTALAERVLGHEVGHFIDLVIEQIGKGKSFARRLRPLTSFRGQMWRSVELRNDARALSRDWRGNFANGDRYRDTAQELFADFMSAMFNSPEWVSQKYPRLHDSFIELRDSKPRFRSAYREIEVWLSGDTLPLEWIEQQRTAAKRTIDDLLTDKPESRRSLGDILRGSLVSMWHRAFEKEGRPKELGKSLTDELEYSHTWAAKENALFADDFSKLVRPELDKVNPDPLEARSLLHAYSQARRTIGERRAAGKWIENNPVEARAMLKAILDLDAPLRSKFGTALDSATNGQLYDLAASVFREIHDRGDRFVRRMEREIDGLNLGIDGDAALQAFNVRGKLLNPGGLTPDNAQKVLDRLRDTLTPEQWTALEQAGSHMRDLLFQTQEKAYREGLISKKVWDELIEPNRGNYMPYSVLDHWQAKVRAGVMPQRGTAKDIADVTLAAQLKIAALNNWRQKQRQTKLLMDVYAAGGQPVTVGERLKRASEIDQIRKRAGDDDISRAVFWRDGQPHLVEFLGDRGKTFERAMESPAFYEHFEWMQNLGRWTHGIMQLYTTFSIPFLVWRNPVRGARTGALRVGFKAIAKQFVTPKELTQGLRLARNYANAAFGAEMLPELRELVDRQMLLPPRLSSAMVRDAGNLRELLENGGVLAMQLRQVRESQWPWFKGGHFGRGAYEFFEKLFSGYEAFEKIANYRAALSRGASPEQAVAIGRRAGIPKPGVGGHLTLFTEIWLPWTRVHIQGARSTLDVLRDPTYRKGFVTRFVATEALPRVLKIAIGTGVAAGTIKWLTRSDEDANDTVMAEVFRRVSPYKMALDDIVPLMLFNPRDGTYHYFNDFKSGSSIPDHYEVVSFRIPASEEGRLWGSGLYGILSTMPGAKEQMARPGENLITSIGQWVANSLAPGISPAIETSGALYDMIARGKNPPDPYRGQPAANELLFDAGGVDRAQAIAGYAMNQLGGPGEIAAVMAMNFGILDERAADALKKRLASDKTPLPERLPLGRSMFAYDNYAKFREQKQADLAEEQLRAKARLVMSDSVRSLYDFYYRNLKHKDELKGADVRRFEVASIFVNDIWGKLTDNDPPSFYAKAAHAAGPDGSAGARETVQRDLDAAAARLLLRFNQ